MCSIFSTWSGKHLLLLNTCLFSKLRKFILTFLLKRKFIIITFILIIDSTCSSRGVRVAKWSLITLSRYWGYSLSMHTSSIGFSKVLNFFASWKQMCSRIEDFGPCADWVFLMEWVDMLMCSWIDMCLTVWTLFILSKLMCSWIDIGRVNFESRTGWVDNESFSYSLANSLSSLSRRASVKHCHWAFVVIAWSFQTFPLVLAVYSHGCYWIQIFRVMNPWETN